MVRTAGAATAALAAEDGEEESRWRTTRTVGAAAAALTAGAADDGKAVAMRHGAAPGGRNAYQSQSVRGTEMMSAPTRRSSAGVRSSPLKNGWMAMRPARRRLAKVVEARA
uniref:Uncharacterized protein n=1 Tax=Oryza rufipogon TaxID=4529 RepID=A0A0E0P6K1_ORYRU